RMACSSSSTSPLIVYLFSLLLLVAIQVESRPSPQKSDPGVLKDLFGGPVSSLLLRQHDINEGSGSSPASASQDSQERGTRLLLDFLGRQRKFRGRTRNSGRGCFGLKLDRIGALSGLGC
uniref:Uncharacterized protein n=1 Tax=Paramormyrops kingsleyae TaxID=1676925 RepID=A0A3B3QIZ6_9TELE